MYTDLAGYVPILPDSWGKTHQCANGVHIGFGADGAITTLTANKVLLLKSTE